MTFYQYCINQRDHLDSQIIKTFEEDIAIYCKILGVGRKEAIEVIIYIEENLK